MTVCQGKTVFQHPAKEPSRLEKQIGMSVEEILSDLPKCCDVGTKKKNGKTYHWKGYKFHLDWADGEIPISVILTSASVHDSQAAIPLAKMTAERVTNLYDLMDAAYDAETIRLFSESLGHVPIVDRNRRKGEKTDEHLKLFLQEALATGIFEKSEKFF